MSRLLASGYSSWIFVLYLLFFSSFQFRPSYSVERHFELVRTAGAASETVRHGLGLISFQGVGFDGRGKTIHAQKNPLIIGHNLYAADLLRVPNSSRAQWNCFFGRWKKKGQVHDRIYFSRSRNVDPTGNWSNALVLIDHGEYRHVNDPSVLIDDHGKYHMLYTAARNAKHPQFGTFFRDWINYSHSTDGLNWVPSAGSESTEITLADPEGLAPGTLTSIARPALVKTDTGWNLWFDGRTNQNGKDEQFHSYLATSTSPVPVDFQIVHRYPDVAGMPGFFEPDVQRRPDGTFLAVVQRRFNELWEATSTDGVNFDFLGPVLEVDHPFLDRDRVSNPGLIYDQIDDRVLGVAFGMAGKTLMDHDIGFAITQYIVQVRSPAEKEASAPIWHTLATSGPEDEQQLAVFQYRKFDLARVLDPITGEIILNQEFSEAHVGDTWDFRSYEQPPNASNSSRVIELSSKYSK